MGHKVSNYLHILQIYEVSVRKDYLTAQHWNSTKYWWIKHSLKSKSMAKGTKRPPLL